MTEAARSAQRYLACVSDPSRFRLLLALGDGARCVTDLAVAIGLSQSCTTRHVQALLREGIVASDRVGKRVMIRLATDGGALTPALRWALGTDAKTGSPGDSGATVERGAGTRPSAPRGPARPAATLASGPPRGAHRRSRSRPPVPAGEPGGAEMRVASPPVHERGWADAGGSIASRPGDEGDGGVGSGPPGGPVESDRPLQRSNELDDFLL